VENNLLGTIYLDKIISLETNVTYLNVPTSSVTLNIIPSLDTVFGNNFSIRKLKPDLAFPDLFIVKYSFDFQHYADYMDKKADRFGLNVDETLNTFSSVSTRQTERPIDFSNKIFHKGKSVNIPSLSYDNKLTLLNELNYDQLQKYNNLECVRSENYIATPTRKLHYPEPFIASASFIHTDIGFIHILHYQFWLWVIFIFLIVFFFITFLCTVRWCNMRTRPRRETRGVSRSKCGDLITACVPVTWAASIIVSESTDASDFYDGFGTAELTIGIRAYQWGWEYYYPKNIDLNYSLKNSASFFTGNSLKYNLINDTNLKTNNLWRFYQNKANDLTLTPSHLILLPIDNNSLTNSTNLNNIGSDNLKESSSFKKIHNISKTLNANLVNLNEPFVTKYKQLNREYLTDSSFNLSTNYGLLRQHNFLNIKSIGSENNAYLDKNSFQKFLIANSNYSQSIESNQACSSTYTTTTDPVSSKINPNIYNTLHLTSTLNKNPNNIFNFFSYYPHTLTKLTTNGTDSLTYPLRKFSNMNNFINKLPTLPLNKNITDTEFSSTNVTNPKLLKLFNDNLSNTLISDPKSVNKSFLPAEQSLRQYTNLEPGSTNFNFLPANASLPTLSLYKYFNEVQSNFTDINKTPILLSNKTYFEVPFSPIFSSNNIVNNWNYDTSYTTTNNTLGIGNKILNLFKVHKLNDIHILRGKRDGAPKFLSTSYWKMFWGNSTIGLRYEPLFKVLKTSSLSYLPHVNNYYDYDFRNLQSYEILEDIFWEGSLSFYNYSDYLTIASNFSNVKEDDAYTTVRKPQFFIPNLDIQPKDSTVYSTATKLNLNPNAILVDNFTSQPSLTNNLNFNLYSLVNTPFSFDEFYENWKNYNLSYYDKSKKTTLVNHPTIKTQNFLSVFNNFRADFDDFNYHNSSLNKVSNLWTTKLNKQTELLNNVENNFKLSNSISLRSTVRNSIVTFNALQKVFKARFEDGRSHTSLDQFSGLYPKQTFLTTYRVPYETLLGKTKNSFFNVNFYAPKPIKIFNKFSSISSSNNYHFFDFPFLLSAKSDMSRYLWFDWFSKWGLVEVQPSSVSRYSTLGVPYLKKPFDYNVENGESLNEVETYLTRISRTRKNYLTNWNYSPFMYLRPSSTKVDNLSFLFKTLKQNHYSLLRTLFLKGHNYENCIFFLSELEQKFTPSFSGLNTYIKPSSKSLASAQSYYYTLSTLVDFLTKREMLYRQYLELNNNLIHLPKEITANPTNPLINEVKNTFNFNDPLIVSSEYSREVFITSLDLFKLILSTDSPFISKIINQNAFFTNLWWFYSLSLKNSTVGEKFNGLWKNPNRPLRKGISNMLRLHSTGAIALPIELRLQILASSRDVIHSWSVPSAGVKIDCVPGYTSHKVMIFLMEGIYWGQCMEICGRYHHWMPIVVYFMRRDLFFLWCTHYVFNSSLDNTWEVNDRQYLDYVKYVSFNKSKWLNNFK
jgi:hypothetical protein